MFDLIRYIAEQDLLEFMSEEEVDRVLMMFEEAAETGKIKEKDFKSWVVSIYIYTPISITCMYIYTVVKLNEFCG